MNVKFLTGVNTTVRGTGSYSLEFFFFYLFVHYMNIVIDSIAIHFSEMSLLTMLKIIYQFL